MAFVFKEERKIFNETSSNKEFQNLGPGTYHGPQEYIVPKNYAPFNSTSDRSQFQKIQQKEEIIKPGPGAYNVIKNPQNEKVLVSTINQEIKIIEVPKPNSVFKSNSKRFNESKISDNPGPGYYNQDLEAKSLNKQVNHNHQSSQQSPSKAKNLINQIMKVNKYQTIPSIPGQQQAFGYSENENFELSLNKNPLINHTGLKNDKIGPGQYEMKSTFEINKNKGPKWKKQNNQKQNKQYPQDLGPGSYDVIHNSNPLYKYKSSSAFASKSLRTFDQIKGQIANKFLMNKVKQQASVTMNVAQDQENNIEEEFEYIQDSVPGPGYYHNESVISSIKVQNKPEKLQFFGSSSVRFKNQQFQSQTIGPGQYNYRQSTFIEPKHSTKKPIPFLTSNNRFEKQVIQDNPGPGNYDPKTTIEDKLIEKIQSGIKGNFGTTEKRFQTVLDKEEQPGPGQYIDRNKVIDHSKPKIQSHYFRSSSQRDVFQPKKDQIPSIGAYELDYFDIGKKKQNELEDDPDLKPQQLYFNSHYKKPKEADLKKKQQQEDDNDDEQTSVIHKQLSDLFKKQNKNPKGNLSQSKRFNYDIHKKDQKPGPGYYDSNQNLWNKRTHNILFADI